MNKDNTGEIQATNAHPMAKKHTIPLPYYIPCSYYLTSLSKFLVMHAFCPSPDSDTFGKQFDTCIHMWFENIC